VVDWFQARRAQPVDLLLAVLLVALVARLVDFFLATPGFITTDTYEVLQGTGAITRCLSHGTSPCGAQVHEFALLQYLPALALKEAGVAFGTAARDLIRLNGLAFLGLLSLAYPIARATGSRVAGAAYLLAILTSPALWYAHAGFGEPLAALATAAMVVGLIAGGRWWLLVPAALLATVSKETAAPFLLLLAYAALLTRVRLTGERLGRARPLAIGAGVAAGVVVNTAFNLFRYDTVRNKDYLGSQLHVPAGQVLKNAGTLVAAPTAGLVWFWTFALVLIAVGLWFARSRLRSPRTLVREPVALALAALLGELVLLAFWFGPTGGAGWGPRLLLPWMPAVVAVVVASSPQLDGLGRFFRPLPRMLALSAVLVVLALPTLAATSSSAHYWHPFPGLVTVPDELAMVPFLGDHACPHYPSIYVSRSYYFRCLNHEMWGRGLAVWRALRATDQIPLTLALLYAAAIVASVAAATRPPRARTAPSDRGPSRRASSPGPP
jgi:hypothetical protein